MSKKYSKKFKRRILNISLLLMLTAIIVLIYKLSNFSKARVTTNIDVVITDAVYLEDSDITLALEAIQEEGESAFCIVLPEYIENYRIDHYNDDIIPNEKIYLTDEQVTNGTIYYSATYDTKNVDGRVLYNQIISGSANQYEVTISGYLPKNSETELSGVDVESTEELIRNKTGEPIVISAALDIKIRANDDIYEPYEFGEYVDVKIKNVSVEQHDTDDGNVWHINENNQVKEMDSYSEDSSIVFRTNGFSVFAIEDTEGTAQAYAILSESILTIDDSASDKAYWNGKNYTDDISGVNSETYVNFADVIINYHGYKSGETDPDRVGFVSLEEKYNVISYHKTVPIINGNISIELIDNPFIDRPTGYGFGGWTTSSGSITTDSKTKTQTLSITGSSSMTINIYTNWATATVVYLNPETGNDNVNDGLTPEKPFGSWGKAFEYVKENTKEISNREKNIIVLTGNSETSPNYSTPITYESGVFGDVTYYPTEDITEGIYMIATEPGTGANVLCTDTAGTAIMDTTLTDNIKPPDTALWEIKASSGGYTLKNVGSGVHLRRSGNNLRLGDPYNWEFVDEKLRDGNRYVKYSGNWTASSSGTKIYFVQYTIENEHEENKREKGILGDNTSYSQSILNNVAVTITSLYNHTDYREQAIMDLTQNAYQDIIAYADLQLEYLKINVSGGYVSSASDGTTVYENFPRIFGRTHNLRIGRGIRTVSGGYDDAVASGVIGGFEPTSNNNVGSASDSNNEYKLVVESGRYSTILGWHARGNGKGNENGKTNNYYGTVYLTLGSDVDRVLNNNDNLSVYYRTTITSGLGLNGQPDKRKMAYLINVKSGKFGVDYFDNGNEDQKYTAGIYIGGYGDLASSTTHDISDRYMIVEGGKIANINCGLKVYSGLTDIYTKLYVKGGEIYNIVGGAGKSTTYGSRILQITGGTIRYSISGGSNGEASYEGDQEQSGKIANGETLVYVGGNAKVGTSDTLGQTLYGVSAGSVFGAGNGNSEAPNSGQVDNAHIIIADNAHILNSVYGGGNYGIVGDRNKTTATAKIDILGGTIDGNVYGGSYQTNIYGSTNINMSAGAVKGTIYGGSNTKGTISTTSTINISGGSLGVESNTSDNPVLFGGGYGQDTVITGDTIITITDVTGSVIAHGSIYGGSEQGSMKGNVLVNILGSADNSNTIALSGNIFAGGKGTSQISANIAGSATINVDGVNSPNGTVFGGNDIKGVTSGAINVTIGGTLSTILNGVYGGGNKADITANIPGVYVYIKDKADVGSAFCGGKVASLLSNSSSTDVTRAIYLQGGKVGKLFGGSDQDGIVTSSHVYVESGTVDSLYGGNNEGGKTNTANVFITTGTFGSVYGGGFEAATDATNVVIEGGTYTNVFGGGNSADATMTSVTFSNASTDNIYGGSNMTGTVASSYVSINSGTAGEVFGGNNAGGNTIESELIVTNSNSDNIYSGGNFAPTVNSTNLRITNCHITGSVYGGGNGAAATVGGDNTTIIEGNTTIGKDVFGGGNAAMTGSDVNNSTVMVDIMGAEIGGDVYGAANTSQVYGVTHMNIGEHVVEHEGLIKGNIKIGGTVFGGGRANTAGSDDYDFTFESVIGNTYVNIDGEGYDDGTYTFDLGKSIFGAGNAATMTGEGYINIKNYGASSQSKENVSIQRATVVTLDNCRITLAGATDRTNEISNALYTFNRIKQLVIKNNTTLFLNSGANILESLYSQDAEGNSARVTITAEGVIDRNVDNRIYMLQGKNLLVTTEAGTYGEIHGMTFVGMYRGKVNEGRTFGMYAASVNHGDATPVLEIEDEFIRNSFVQGKHYESHNIEVDGFYTNYDEEGTVITKYIIPTPEVGEYYQWIVGDNSENIYFEGTELIATKYNTTSAVSINLDGLNTANMLMKVVSIDTSDLADGVIFKEESDISNLEADPNIANNVFALTMSAGNVGWASRSSTEFLRSGNTEFGTYKGATQYQSDNSNATPALTLNLGHSKNISENKLLGSVAIRLEATYLIDSEESPGEQELIMKNVFIMLDLSTNNTASLANDYYEGTVSPGKKYTMFPTTNTSITSNSVFSAYYSLYLGNYSKSVEEGKYKDDFKGYEHWLMLSAVLPADTKITMVDRSKDQVKYYYYITTPDDERNRRQEFKFTDFKVMGSTEEQYSADETYYDEGVDIVYEEFIFHVDFGNARLGRTIDNQNMIVQLRNAEDNSMALTVNRDQYPMLFNVFSDQEATKNAKASSNRTYAYIGESFNVNIDTTYLYQTVNAETVYDTRNFDDQMGVKVSVLDGSEQLGSVDLTGFFIECGGVRYYARQDGTYRVRLSDAVANVNKNLVFNTTNSNLETKNYTLVFETFGSFDGINYSTSIATDSLDIQLINSVYGLKVEADDKAILIDKDTGINQNGTNAIRFNVTYFGNLKNPKIYITLNRRDYSTEYSTIYHPVDLSGYVKEALTPTDVEYEYLFTETAQDNQAIVLKLNPNLITGTYRVMFKLYDDVTFIGSDEQSIIIK